MDSLSPSVVLPYSSQAVEDINSLLKCWNPKLTLRAVAYHSETLESMSSIMQVPQQQGTVDCGVHVMKHNTDCHTDTGVFIVASICSDFFIIAHFECLQ